MQVTVENVGELGRKMNITVPAEKISQLAQARLEEVAKTVKLDGFRPGKVPMNVVKKQYGEAVFREITEQVISGSLAEAFTQENLQPAAQPVMDPSAGLPEEGKDYAFAVTFEVYPEIKPADFKKIKLTKEIATPSEDMVEEMLGRLKAAQQNFSAKEGAAEMNDRVIINAEGYLEGEDKPFDNSQLNDFKLVLGSGQLIPGFEEGLVGTKAGDKKDVAVTFPENYQAKELAGKPATFKCEVTAVEAPAEVEVNDEFAKQFGAESKDDLMTKIREQIASDLTNMTEQKLKKELFDALDAANSFTLPSSILEEEYNSVIAAQKQELSRQGMPTESLDNPEESVEKEYRDLARRRVALGLLLAEIGKQAEIKVGKADIDAEIAKISAQNPMMKDQIEKFYADPQNQQQIAGPLFEQKVTDHILENVKLEEKEIDADALMKSLQGA